MKKMFRFYADAGHGWLQVPKRLLEELGIAAKITSFSYEDGDNVYLEEDCDMSTFINSLRQRGIEHEFLEYHTEYSRIRSFKPYCYESSMS